MVAEECIKRLLVALEGLGLGADPDDLHCCELVAALDLIDDILSGHHMTEDRMFAVQMRGRHMGDEELAAVGVGAGVGHGEDAGARMLQGRIDLVGEGVARTAGPGSQRTAALDHEIRDNPVEGQAIVEFMPLGSGAAAEIFRPFGQTDEVGDGQRGLFVFEHTEDFPFLCNEFRVDAIIEFLLSHSCFSEKKCYRKCDNEKKLSLNAWLLLL